MDIFSISVVAFTSTIAAINKSAILADYREHPGFLARFPSYRVTMGFGLHLGSAIEGAIGSEFKIDASYLSPNVNMASRLDAATKQFGVSLLMSHHIIQNCSPKLKSYCRQIDSVTVKGIWFGFVFVLLVVGSCFYRVGFVWFRSFRFRLPARSNPCSSLSRLQKKTKLSKALNHLFGSTLSICPWCTTPTKYRAENTWQNGQKYDLNKCSRKMKTCWNEDSHILSACCITDRYGPRDSESGWSHAVHRPQDVYSAPEIRGTALPARVIKLKFVCVCYLSLHP